jgi:hypothetical protein
MASRGLARGLMVVLTTAIAAALLSACGGGSSSDSGNANALLHQTFTGQHSVKSGVLGLDLTLGAAGAGQPTNPISLSLSGPFQSRGTGKLPESNFTIAFNGDGQHGQFGLVSTGNGGYVTLDGNAYQLPASDFSKLSSSFSSAGGQSGSANTLSKLGINPLHWLSDPKVVGTETVGGANTTHIRAGVDVAALLGDLNTMLAKVASTGATTGTLSASTRQRIAGSVKNASVDVWTGTDDKTLRKLALNLDFPISGSTASLLGGAQSAGLGLTFQYSDLNQPQTISAPANVKPFGGFENKLRGIFSELGSAGLGLSGTGSGSNSSPSTSNFQKYNTCIHQAGGNVAKLQKCAPLLNGGG